MKPIFVFLFLTIVPFRTVLAQNPGDNLFNTPIVHDVQMYFSQANYWDSLKYYYEQIYVTGNKTYMSSDSIIVDGYKMVNVGVRLKGNSAYGWAANLPSVKLPFKLDFNRYVSGQKLDQLKKLNLHNEDRDPTVMRSKIISDFLVEQGVHAPRVTYTRVTINGIYWGLYTMVEQLDKTFLNSKFGNDQGNLYKAFPRFPFWEGQGGSTLAYLGGQPSDYDSVYLLKTNTTVNNWSGFTNLLYEINYTSNTEFRDSLEAVMNTDSYLKAWAAMSLFVNHDAYPFLGNNYYLYHNPSDNKFQWVAWDFNLGIGSARGVLSIYQAENSSIYYLPGVQGSRPLASRMLDEPYYYDRYREWVCHFANTAFDTTFISPKIDSIAASIRPHYYADTNKFYSNNMFEENLVVNVLSFPGLKSFIANRRLAVLDELITLGGCPTLAVSTASELNKVRIYPNPISEMATIEVVGLHRWSWAMYNSLGQEVQSIDNISDRSITISRGNLGAGIYFYEVKTSDALVETGKIILE